jgi:hypothetical protein
LSNSGAPNSSATIGTTIISTATISRVIDTALPRNTASRDAGDSSSARIVSPSRSRSKARPRPIVPANATDTQMMPGVASATTPWSLTKANENTTTSRAAKNVIV